MDRKSIARVLIAHYGKTYAEEIGIQIERNTPAPLFQLLCAALLYSARINTANATRAMRALLAAGLDTPKKMAAATWQDRVDVLTANGYKRYDESASSQLGAAARRVEVDYRGDLRRLRTAADHDVAIERELLMQFKGIGIVGADIFLREVQGAWPEVYPFADRRVLESARKLGLGKGVRDLAELVTRSQFPALVAALIRVELADDFDAVRSVAGGAASPAP